MAGDLDQALGRLNAALEAAEAAVGRAIDSADAARLKEEELQAFADDRVRLAELLDVSAVETGAVKERQDEIARRLDAAIAGVEQVIEQAGR